MKRMIIANSYDPHEASTEYDWLFGLYWDWDGHEYRVTDVDSSLVICRVTESWVAEDTGEDVQSTQIFRIREDAVGNVFLQSKKYPEFKLYANSALNYEGPEDMEQLDDDSDVWDEDDYTPSASRGDYSPSNPWDAPGMSIHDFI